MKEKVRKERRKEKRNTVVSGIQFIHKDYSSDNHKTILNLVFIVEI